MEQTNNNEVDKIIEEAMSSMKIIKRRRYPKIQLSKQFVACLKNEFKLLREQGLSDKIIIDRLSRAIPFHINEE